MANHSRWCDKNPKRKEYVEKSKNSIEAMNTARKKSGFLNAFEKARIKGEKIPVHPMKGKNSVLKGKKHTEKTKQILREKALKSKHRRLRRGIIEYNGLKLDSSWELELAKRLDKLEIEWIRPDPLVWVDDDGITHNYFPDFYLPKHDLYLDPKNSYAVKVQEKS